MQTLAIVRGVQTSLAKPYAMHLLERSKSHTILATIDEMFTHVISAQPQRIEYKFRPRLLGAAHDLCYGRVMRGLEAGADVVVSNPFSTRREVGRYIVGVKKAFPKCLVHVFHVTAPAPEGITPGYEQGSIPQRVIDNLTEKWEPWHGEHKVIAFTEEDGATYETV